MNPQECLKRLIAALEESDRQEAADAADDLATWIRWNGIVPVFDPHSLSFAFDSFADYLRK